jgi:hypothetical protein
MADDEHTWATIESVYPEQAQEQRDHGDFIGLGDYGPLLRSWGYSVLLQVDDDDILGDSRLLLLDRHHADGRFGYLKFGWGSCSGCDALQGCQSLDEIAELRRDLHARIQWGTRAELLAFLRTHDWEGEYDWGAEQRRFVRAAIALLDDPGGEG